jgi:hypothetical protein
MLSRMRISNFYLVLLVLALLISVFLPGAAQATGGKQVRLVIQDHTDCCGWVDALTWLRVTGGNQDGVLSFWEQSFSPERTEVITTNWWWKGSVTLRFKVHIDRGTTVTRQCNIFVGSTGSTVHTVTYSYATDRCR